MQYRSYQLECTLDLTEEIRGSEIYKMGILSSMMELTRIWRELPTSVIHICWNHTILVDSGGSNDVGVEGEVAVENEVREFLCHVSKNNRVTMEDFSNLEDEKDCIEEVNDECVVASILAKEGEDELTYYESDGRTADVVV